MLTVKGCSSTDSSSAGGLIFRGVRHPILWGSVSFPRRRDLRGIAGTFSAMQQYGGTAVTNDRVMTRPGMFATQSLPVWLHVDGCKLHHFFIEMLELRRFFFFFTCILLICSFDLKFWHWKSCFQNSLCFLNGLREESALLLDSLCVSNWIWPEIMAVCN